MKDVEDRRPVEDYFWAHRDYLDLFAAAKLGLLAEHRPLGRPDEPYEWLSETTVSPWVLYVVGRARGKYVMDGPFRSAPAGRIPGLGEFPGPPP